jgi:CheY-like chemotaxis protein
MDTTKPEQEQTLLRMLFGEMPRADCERPRGAAETTRPKDGPWAPSSCRVLVVDDNRDAAETLAQVIQALGHIAYAAFDGPSALELVEQFEPDLGLLDLGLPGMDGYELGRRLRERLPDLYLVAVSGYGQDSDKERSLAAGFADHLVKPIEMEAIEALLAERMPVQPARDEGEARAAAPSAATTRAR